MASIDGPVFGRVRGFGWVLCLVLVAAVLRTAGSTRVQISAAVADPQGFVTAAGADQFVLALATGLGWLLLGWVTVGAALLLGCAAPGLIGWLFAHLTRMLVPATLQRFVSLALGIGLVTGSSVASAAPPAAPPAVSVTLDWPGVLTNPPEGVPDWPPAVPAPPPAGTIPAEADAPAVNRGSYEVQPGDCLWDIAERSLAQAGQRVDLVSVAAAVTAWWQANSTHIADPDLIYPGQVLVAPTP